MIEKTGVFDGECMIGGDKKAYPVPPNYASKSRLVEGDKLKLTITDDGKFIYKQMFKVNSGKFIAEIVKINNVTHAKWNDFVYKISSSSISYYELKEGMEIIILIPLDKKATWCAVDGVIK